MSSFGQIGAFRTLRSLPYDAEVEYLESTGTQYIDTGYAFASDNHEWVVSVSDVALPSGATQAAWLFGSYLYPASNQKRSGGLALQTTGATMGIGIGGIGAGSTSFTIPKPTQSVEISIKAAVTGFTMTDGLNVVTGSFAGSSITGLREYLFCLDHSGFSGVNAPCVMKCYGAKIYDNGILVRDLQPVRFTNELGQTEGAMYDRFGVGGMNPDGSARTDGLYRNRGTGAFLYGNDI